jgi:hypothetical protein
MKMGYGTVENAHVQKVLFPLLDYCTDISVVNRAETLLEDGLRLWLVTLVSSRLETMGPSLNNVSLIYLDVCVTVLFVIFDSINLACRCFPGWRPFCGLDWKHICA